MSESSDSTVDDQPHRSAETTASAKQPPPKFTQSDAENAARTVARILSKAEAGRRSLEIQRDIRNAHAAKVELNRCLYQLSDSVNILDLSLHRLANVIRLSYESRAEYLQAMSESDD